MATLIKIKQGHREEVTFALGEEQNLSKVLAMLCDLSAVGQEYADGYHNVLDSSCKITIHINETVLTKDEYKKLREKYEASKEEKKASAD